MAITVTATPARLTWRDFTITPSRIADPNDGTLQDAVTAFNYNIPALPPIINANGVFRMADPNVITVTPNARVFHGAGRSAAFLAHEQLHYDVGIVICRALARHMMRLRARSLPALVTDFRNAVNLHINRRAVLIQRRYDMDSRHGTNAHYQRIWSRRMAQCLANPNSQKIGGFWL